MSVIKVEHIYKKFGDVEVLKDINLEVEKGEVICIIGPSGSGKSTFLRCLNHLEHITDGTIYLDDEVLDQMKNGKSLIKNNGSRKKKTAEMCMKLGMVFQRFNLFPHKTVLENVIEAPIHVKGKKKEEIMPYALELIKKVGLAEKVNEYPARLSGGQQQRVAIVRALAMDPEIMLFDEPTSALDPELVYEVLEVIKDLAKTGMTMLIVTHEMNFAREIADRIVFMDGGQITMLDTPEKIFNNPDNKRMQEFLKKYNG
ncbi:MAG: amino acid ABC transporter ATP-binding protein [Peptococcaceae bacterium]|jgi:polar amino acid transport system ATP-binding protein|nr:amino acid ABC transporter ATP-binding protein [Peptococcaceae bacterium]